MEEKTVFNEIEPELAGRLATDADAVDRASKVGFALASAPIALGVLASTTFGQGASLPGKIVDVLNFALTLEFLEDEFYRTALGSGGLVPAETRAVFEQISKHEAAHVRVLQGALGSKATPKPTFDYTAGGAFPDVFSNYQTFLAVSQAFEDTGVRAYKGQAGNLKSNDQILTTALQIHSVEARHAAEVRRIRGERGWITGNSRGTLPAPTQPIYNGEENSRQGGKSLTGVAGLSDSIITEAFDEPLSKKEVLAIAGLFIRK
ncbi:MAG: ferritin-like domain-containing protein [Pyrinomonadaceae bacterium]